MINRQTDFYGKKKKATPLFLSNPLGSIAELWRQSRHRTGSALFFINSPGMPLVLVEIQPRSGSKRAGDEIKEKMEKGLKMLIPGR